MEKKNFENIVHLVVDEKKKNILSNTGADTSRPPNFVAQGRLTAAPFSKFMERALYILPPPVP